MAYNSNIPKKGEFRHGRRSQRVFKSVTSNKRSEFRKLGEVLNELGSKGYSAHPYSAYDR